MPELPEIARYKTYVDATVLNKEIAEVHFPQTKLLQAPEGDYKNALCNKRFTGTKQLGKYLFFATDGEKLLVFHFGMTGKFESYQHGEDPKYSQMIITFKDASRLAFLCRRKLGKIFLAEDFEAFREENELGKHVLDITWEEFEEIFQKKKGSIKTAITDQHLLAGIGNVYADEILFQSNIHPKTKIEKLSETERKNIFKEISAVLKTAIKHEGNRAELPSGYLIPHREEGAECPVCKGKIEMIKVSGRSTYFCPACQKEQR